MLQETSSELCRDEGHMAGGGAGTMVSATCMSLLEDDSGRPHLCPLLWPGRREWLPGGMCLIGVVDEKMFKMLSALVEAAHIEASGTPLVCDCRAFYSSLPQEFLHLPHSSGSDGYSPVSLQACCSSRNSGLDPVLM